MVGQITINNESEYRKEIEDLVMWCNENNLSLNVDKTKELIIAFRKKGGEYASININGTEVERVESIKFLGLTITDNLLDFPHRCDGQEGTTAPLLPQVAQTIGHVHKVPHQLLQMHHLKHIVQ
eukprot:g48243.t1